MKIPSKPILFSAEMVKSILAGKKTMTRRVIKPQPDCMSPGGDPVWLEIYHGKKRIKCPYGRAGHLLWVRESWRIGAWSEDGEVAIDYLADNHARKEWLTVPETEQFEKYFIQCTDDCIKAELETDMDGMYAWLPGEAPTRKRPSIFMPRWASRITLKITGIRVERLNQIKNSDAKREGVNWWPEYVGVEQNGGPKVAPNYIDPFRKLWSEINGKESWVANPWVWVVEFEKI